jgi:hypothetical protein
MLADSPVENDLTDILDHTGWKIIVSAGSDPDAALPALMFVAQAVGTRRSANRSCSLQRHTRCM